MTTKKSITNEYGCLKLIDAVLWSAIVDVINGWQKNKALSDYNLIRDVNYRTAVSFLRASEKGKRIMNILNNLDDEQRAKLLEDGGVGI